MPANEKELRQTIVDIGRLVYQKGWVASNDGNISVRIGPDRMLATCTGVSKGMMSVDDIIICDLKGNKVEGKRERTSEILMHTTIYEMRPDVNAVVHAHTPVATGFALAGKALTMALLPEVIVGLGCVPLAQYGLPGTWELSETLKPYIPTYDALLMANHGVVCYGPDLYNAFFKMETVEHSARVTLVAELLGGPKALPRAEVDKLIDSRSRYGITSRAGAAAGCPIAADESGPEQERFLVTRDELLALVDEAVRARG